MNSCLTPPQVAADEQVLSHCVARVPIFNHLPDEALAVISSKASMRAYERGQFIHRAGAPSDRLYIVHHGKIKVYRLSDGGKEQLVRILNAGDFTGELALFSSGSHDSYAEALQASHVCTIHREDVRELLIKFPDISLHVLAELSRRLGESEKQTAAIATASINARLAQFLVDQADHEASGTFNLPMNRRHLASFLGTSPETISRRLGEFEEAGWIHQVGQRQITLLDRDALLGVE